MDIFEQHERTEQLRRDEFIETLSRAIAPGMTAEQCARRVAYVCAVYAARDGQHPRSEVGTKRQGKAWKTYWDAGPYMWGIGASMALTHAGARLVETDYGCDVLFYEDE